MTKKNIFNQAIWLSIANSSNMLVAILSSVILSRFFDKYEYGTYKQIIFVYNTFLVIFQAGLPNVFSYFLPRYSIAQGKYIMSSLNRLLFLLGLIFSLFLFFSSNIIADIINNPELENGLKIFSIFPLFTIPTLGVEGLYISLNNTKFIAFYQLFTRLLMLSFITLPVIFINNSYEMALVGWGIASFISFVVSSIAKNYPYKKITPEKIENISSKILKYSVPIMGSSILMLFFNSVNQFFISRYCGVEKFAEFSNGFITLPFVPIIIAPFRQLLVPLFSKANLENNYDYARSVFFTGVNKILLLMIPIISFSMLEAKDIMVFLYGKNYSNSTIYFQIFLIFNFVEMFPYTTILHSIGKTDILFRYDLFGTISVWTVGFIFAKFNLIAPEIFALSFTVINILIKYIFPYIYIKSKMRLNLFNKNLCKSLFIALFHSIIPLLLITFVIRIEAVNNMIPVYRIILSGILYIILLVVTSRFFGINYKRLLQNNKA